MESISAMKYRKHEKLQQVGNLIEAAARQNRKFNPEEEINYARFNAEIDSLSLAIIGEEADAERRQKLATREMNMKTGNQRPGTRDIDPDKEFRGIGEYFSAIARLKIDGVRDARLDALAETREMTMGMGSTGGYALPQQFDATVRQAVAQESVIRPRALVIPAGSPPDSKLTFPALDQTAAQNIYGGVTVVHTGEGVTMTETTAKLREVSLEPKEISAYIVCTQKLLNNWEAAGAFIGKQLASAIAGTEDYDFTRGNGVNKALGYINCAAAISYSRAGANGITFGDVTGMLARALMRGGSYIWLASQTTIPALATMVDSGGHATWIGSRADGLAGAQGPMPAGLFGMPIIFGDRLPALGTKGDLSLVNLSYYLIKDGSGPAAASSEHVLFTQNKVCFKIVWNTDGHSWLTEPLGLEGSPTNTVSPFVVLE